MYVSMYVQYVCMHLYVYTVRLNEFIPNEETD